MSLIATSSKSIKFNKWLDGDCKDSYSPTTNKNEFINSLSWSKDGSWLVLVPGSGPAEIISVKENVKLLHKVKEVEQPICAIFSKTSKKCIALGTHSGQLLLYDIKSKTVQKRFPKAASTINKIDCNANDTHLAAAISTGDILTYNMMSSTLSTTYKIPNCNSASTLSFHPKKRCLLAAGSNEGVVAVWDINNSVKKVSFQAHYAPVTGLAFSPVRTDLIATIGNDRKFTFYDIENKKTIIQMEVPSSMLALDFSYCGYYIGMGCQNGYVIIYDTRNLAKPVNAFSAHEGMKVTQLCFQNAVKSKSVEDDSITIADEKSIVSEIQENNNIDIEDSFMVSLEKVDYSYVSSPLQENNLKKTPLIQVMELKPQTVSKDDGNKHLGHGKSFSTPNNERPISIESPKDSPIIIGNTGNNNLNLNVAEVKECIGEIVREEMAILKNLMEKNFICVQMGLVKQFMTISKEINEVKEEVELLKQKITEREKFL